MAAFSMDLRQRIVAACDASGQTRQEVADRFGVSLGMVKKLLVQRRRTGDIAAGYSRCGRPPKILPTHRKRLGVLMRQAPDLTLVQLRERTGLRCSLVAIHLTLVKMGLTYKKRHSAPASKAARTSPANAAPGGRTSAPAASRPRG